MADGTIFAMPEIAYHELNHSVACQLRIGHPRVNAFVEGFAVMYDPLPWQSEKDENVILTEMFADTTPPYATAGHFVRWLFEREGPETLADLYRIPSDLEEFPGALEDLYGLTFEQLKADYQETTPWKWAPLRQCTDLPDVTQDPDGVWHYSGPPMDCDDEETMGPFLRERFTPSNDWDLMYQSFTFSLEGDEGIYLDYTLSDGIYEVSFERCLEEHVQIMEPQLLSGGSMIPKTDGAQTFPHLCPGTWRANVLALYGAADPAQPTEVSFWHLTDSPIELPPQNCD